MPTRTRSKPVYPYVVSSLALFVALGGSAYAVSKVGTKDLENRAVTNSKIANNTIRGKKVKESTLEQVPDAKTLDGNRAEDFVSTFSERRFNIALPFGQSQEILSAGSLRVVAHCLQNSTDNGGNANRDIARLLISTTENAAVFEGSDSKDGTNAGDLLNVDTPEADRVLDEHSVPTGTTDFSNNGDFGARDPNGVSILAADDHLNYTVGLYGVNCTFTGVTEVVGAP